MMRSIVSTMSVAVAAAAAAAQAPPAGSIDPDRFVLVAFAGDRQVGFIRPASIRAEGSLRSYETLWIYTPPVPAGRDLLVRAVRRSRADCARGVSGGLGATFYGEGIDPLSSESESARALEHVPPGSAQDDVYRFVCFGREPYPAFRTAADWRDAALLAGEIAAFYHAHPTR